MHCKKWLLAEDCVRVVTVRNTAFLLWLCLLLCLMISQKFKKKLDSSSLILLRFPATQTFVLISGVIQFSFGHFATPCSSVILLGFFPSLSVSFSLFLTQQPRGLSLLTPPSYVSWVYFSCPLRTSDSYETTLGDFRAGKMTWNYNIFTFRHLRGD